MQRMPKIKAADILPVALALCVFRVRAGHCVTKSTVRGAASVLTCCHGKRICRLPATPYYCAAEVSQSKNQESQGMSVVISS